MLQEVGTTRVSDESFIKNNTWNCNQRDTYTAAFYLIQCEEDSLTYDCIRIIIIIITWSLQQVHSLYQSKFFRECNLGLPLSIVNTV